MSGRIPNSFIDQLLDRADIAAVIGARVTLSPSGREFKALCPFHNERTPSFYVIPHKQFYHCFGCGAHGNVIGFLMDYERLSYPDAIATLASETGMDMPARYVEEDDARQALREVLAAAEGYFRKQLGVSEKARAYCRDRGLGEEILERYRVGYAPAGWDHLQRALRMKADLLTAAGLVAPRKSGSGHYDRFRDRLIFPIHDARGRPIAFGDRILESDPDAPKYLNSPETELFSKGKALYGLKQASGSPLLVAEGYIDVLALAQAGFAAVATQGTAVTSYQVERLLRRSREVVYCFDGDQAGRRAAERALDATLPHLAGDREVRLLFLPEKEDPDSLLRSQGVEHFRNLLGEATPLAEFFFAHIASGLDLSTIDGRARLLALARPRLLKLPEGAYRDLMNQRLAELTHEKAEARARPRLPSRRRERPSLLRQTLRMLLDDPTLAQQAGELALLRKAPDTGEALFLEVIELCREHPNVTTGGVLERFRGRKEGEWLGALLQQAVLREDENKTQEFHDAVLQLERNAARRRIHHLKDGLHRGALSQAEKEELSELLRHTTSVESQ